MEQTVPQFDDKQFQEHFRLSRQTVQHILNDFSRSHTLPTYRAGRENVTPEKGLLMCIWYLANQETYREMSDRFNVCQSTALITIRKVVKYFVTIRQRYIKWPTEEEAVRISNNFRIKQGIAGVIGAIDATHININKPSQDQNAYCNRKGQHSIILQGVADDKKRFISAYCGESGCNHDARVFRRSNVYKKYSANGLPNERFLLGDSAYPNLSWVVVPLKDNGFLTDNQKLFNYRHSSTRIIIENTFGLLKGRFRRLQHFSNVNITFIVEATIAACVLHNICITMDDLNMEYHFAAQNEMGQILEYNNLNEEPENNNIDRRQLIYNQMFA